MRLVPVVVVVEDTTYAVLQRMVEQTELDAETRAALPEITATLGYTKEMLQLGGMLSAMAKALP